MNNQTALIIIILVIAIGAIAVVGIVFIMLSSNAPPSGVNIVQPAGTPQTPQTNNVGANTQGTTTKPENTGNNGGTQTPTIPEREPLIVATNEVFGPVLGDQRDQVLDEGYVIVEFFYLDDAGADVKEAQRQIMSLLHDIAQETKEILIVSKIEAMASFDYYSAAGAGTVPSLKIIGQSGGATILRSTTLIYPLTQGTLTNVIMEDVCSKTWRCDIVDGRLRKNV